MRPAAVGVTVLLAAAALIVPGCATTGAPDPALSHSVTEPGATLAEGEGLPGALSGEVSAAAAQITQALGQRAEFGSIGVNQTGGGLVLYWHGDPPTGMLNDIEASHPGLTVEVRPTTYLPGDLRDAARRLLTAEGDAGVGAVSPRPDGTGLTALVREDAVREGLDGLAARLSAQAGVPVSVETGAPVPAWARTRQDSS